MFFSAPSNSWRTCCIWAVVAACRSARLRPTTPATRWVRLVGAMGEEPGDVGTDAVVGKKGDPCPDAPATTSELMTSNVALSDIRVKAEAASGHKLATLGL